MIIFPTTLSNGDCIMSIEDAIDYSNALSDNIIDSKKRISELSYLIVKYQASINPNEDREIRQLAYKLVGVYTLMRQETISNDTFEKVLRETSRNYGCAVAYLYKKCTELYDDIQMESKQK